MTSLRSLETSWLATALQLGDILFTEYKHKSWVAPKTAPMIQASISNVQHYFFDPAASLRSEHMPAGAPLRSRIRGEKGEALYVCMLGKLSSSDSEKNFTLGQRAELRNSGTPPLPLVQSESFKSSPSYICRVEGDAPPGDMQ